MIGKINYIKMRKLLIMFLCLSLVFVGFVSATDLPEIKIILKERAEVSGEWYYLGDIADIHILNSDIGYELENIQIGRSPLPGSSRAVSFGYVQTRIHQAGINSGKYKLDGYNSIQVTRLSQCIPASYMEEEVIKAIRDRVSEELDIEIEFASLPSDLVLPFGVVSIELNLPTPLPKGRYFTVRLEISINGAPYRLLSIMARVHIYGEALVCVNRISMHDTISMSDLQLERVRLSDISGTPLSSIDEGQIRAVRLIPQGRVLLAEHIEPIPHVMSGDELNIVVEVGNVHVKSTGISSSNAIIGDTVSVRNTQSGKVVTGVLIDRETVRIN